MKDTHEMKNYETLMENYETFDTHKGLFQCQEAEYK